MRIYKMTATFGKLNNETLTLKPGLNLIEAPNEWGKSTWCAFLIAMLYGISTSTRTTKDFLAEKEHYAPWSGAPMSGSIDLSWNGRDITIERSTKGRSIFGQFQAYETHTGLPVPELTAANCGQQLLGVEQGVFTRTGFLRFTDLPVTDDNALRKRLNALVTTGDESGAEDTLSKKLKDLKNACRFHKTGKLPQAEAQRNALQSQLVQIDSVQKQIAQTQARQEALKEDLALLQTHEAVLAYEQAKKEQTLLENTKAEVTRLREKAEDLAVVCASLPSAEETRYKIAELGDFQQKWASLHERPLPVAPSKPEVPAPFAGLSGAEAVDKATFDTSSYKMLSGKVSPLPLVLALAFLLAGIGLLFVNYLLTLPCILLCVFFFFMHKRNSGAQQKERTALLAPYGAIPAANWLALAKSYREAEQKYLQADRDYQEALSLLQREKDAMTAQLKLLTSGITVSDCLARWNEILALREELEDTQKAYLQAKKHEADLASVVKAVNAPQVTDLLTYSPVETQRRIRELTAEQAQLSARLGRLDGQLVSLGDPDAAKRELAKVNAHIAVLEDTYAALTVAQETAAAASAELQRRFAPEISKLAQTLFSRLTAGRYQKVTLSQDFSLQLSAEEETTLRSTLWRSDGTVDQLYLALRLAVARVLTPNAPLVLDDALVRFDETRLAEALKLLQEEAETRQVIVFTCQKREKQLLERR